MPVRGQKKNDRAKQRNESRRLENIAKKEKIEQRWRVLSPQQQLELLDKRLGVGVGAKKQRAKIAEKLKGV